MYKKNPIDNKSYQFIDDVFLYDYSDLVRFYDNKLITDDDIVLPVLLMPITPDGRICLNALPDDVVYKIAYTVTEEYNIKSIKSKLNIQHFGYLEYYFKDLDNCYLFIKIGDLEHFMIKYIDALSRQVGGSVEYLMCNAKDNGKGLIILDIYERIAFNSVLFNGHKFMKHIFDKPLDEVTNEEIDFAHALFRENEFGIKFIMKQDLLSAQD